MNSAQDDYVQDKTRHIVGRAALRRASAMVQHWRVKERENARLAKRLTIGLLILALACASLFFLI
jgi:hypothetical protein